MLRTIQPQKLLRNFCSIYSNIPRTLVTKADIMTETKEEIQENKTDETSSTKRPLEDKNECETKKQKIEPEPFIRIKRRNYAMLLGYFGKDYYGMQRNPGVHTIEEDLIKAMLKANLITSESFETIQNINFQRAARTDKGVSAMRQVVSLKLPENPCKDSINKHLPDDIRVFSIKRVTRGFNSKAQCDARTYSYTLPTFAFAPENLEVFNQLSGVIDIEKRMEELSIIDGKSYLEYRISEETKQRLRETLKQYEGTQNFCNFTSRLFPLDPRAKRYIMSFEAEEPFIVDNMELITLKVKGQSFMMHQIRKMVSLVIALIRNIITKETFQQAFEKEKFDITRAPSLGLVLNIVHYKYYDKRYGSDGVHEPLDWQDCHDEVEEFAKNKIYKHIIDTEFKEKNMLAWLADLTPKSYGIRDESKDENKEEDGIDDIKEDS